MPRVVIHDRALEEISAIFAWIAPKNFDAALRVNQAIEEAIQFLADHHEAGALVETEHAILPVFRFWPIRKYTNYLVIYVPRPDGIDVLRVIHAAQDISRVQF